ncbi:ATP-binding protein [Paenibacillaceae bacterium WGS1546]|uniref:ATP-binding protein n=1 Tax=Cohnella sp. WGS1546 TaxID=3366810 RepID=UPI00372D6E90
MSIKAKLSLFIAATVTIILALNISIYYFGSKNELESELRQEMITIAKQVGSSLDAAEKAKRFMEESIGEKLRAAAIAAKSALDPRSDRVTNERLAELSRELGIDHISLWSRTDDDIVVVKSSNPDELGIGSKTWDYWYEAFNELLDKREVTIEQGQKLRHYWSGPTQFSTSDPDSVNKWGYYFDGSTDYIINPYIDARAFLAFDDQIGTASLIQSLKQDNPDILEITGFDPKFFGKPQIVKVKKGRIVRNLDVRDIPFGSYEYANPPADAAFVKEAEATGGVVAAKMRLQGKDVIKSFIPLSETAPFVISVVFDYEAITGALNRQLALHSAIALGLIVLAWIASYIVAGWLIRPLRHVLDNVNEIAEGRFGRRIDVRSRDELGFLSNRVNAMARHLQDYTGKLRDSAEELRSMKEYLESFVNHTSDAIYVTDLDGKTMRINQAFEKMFGWSGAEVIGQRLPNVPAEYAAQYEAIRRRVESGEAVADYETVRLRKDGKTIDASITVSPIRDEDQTVVAIAEIARNISARKQTDEVIRRSEKLAVIGQLAAGVAHEIRNPLTTLRGFVQLGRKGTLTPAYLEVMLSELDRINLIVGELLVLSKPQASRFRQVDVRELLNDIATLMDPQAGLLNLKIETRCEDGLPSLLGDPNQLKQVFINLLKNSIESMQETSGTIVVEAAAESGTDVFEAAVAIRVIDKGRGISEEDLKRVGEPFFTSKSSGTGLGIMVSQRIIANHRGTMSIRSKVGEGTCVEIRLPIRP